MIPSQLPGNRNPLQTDRGQGEMASHLPSPLCPAWKKKVKHWLYSPHFHSSSWEPQGSFALLFLHFGLFLVTPCSLSSFIAGLPCIFYLLLEPSISSLGPPDPRASGEAASLASTLLPAKALHPSLPSMWDSHSCSNSPWGPELSTDGSFPRE